MIMLFSRAVYAFYFSLFRRHLRIYSKSFILLS